MKLITIGLTCVALATSASALAGDVAAGKKIAETTCVACHNPTTGEGLQETYPNLGGQKKTYLISSIKAYKSGQRKGGMSMLMTPMVANLSDKDIENVSAYFSSLKK